MRIVSLYVALALQSASTNATPIPSSSTVASTAAVTTPAPRSSATRSTVQLINTASSQTHSSAQPSQSPLDQVGPSRLSSSNLSNSSLPYVAGGAVAVVVGAEVNSVAGSNRKKAEEARLAEKRQAVNEAKSFANDRLVEIEQAYAGPLQAATGDEIKTLRLQKAQAHEISYAQVELSSRLEQLAQETPPTAEKLMQKYSERYSDIKALFQTRTQGITDPQLIQRAKYLRTYERSLNDQSLPYQLKARADFYLPLFDDAINEAAESSSPLPVELPAPIVQEEIQLEAELQEDLADSVASKPAEAVLAQGEEEALEEGWLQRKVKQGLGVLMDWL